MTSAEFKCLRESMGLTTKWLADRWGVAEFSVKRWERDRMLPAGFEEDMRDLKARFDREVAQAATTPEDSCIIVPRVDAEAPRGLPAAWFHAVAQRASEKSGARILFYGDEQL